MKKDTAYTIVSAVIGFLAVNYIYDKKEIKILKDLVESNRKLVTLHTEAIKNLNEVSKLQNSINENTNHLIDTYERCFEVLADGPIEEEKE